MVICCSLFLRELCRLRLHKSRRAAAGCQAEVGHQRQCIGTSRILHCAIAPFRFFKSLVRGVVMGQCVVGDSDRFCVFQVGSKIAARLTSLKTARDSSSFSNSAAGASEATSEGAVFLRKPAPSLGSRPGSGCGGRLSTHRCRSPSLHCSALTGSALFRSGARHHPTLPGRLRSHALRSLRSLRVLCDLRTVVLCLTAQDRYGSAAPLQTVNPTAFPCSLRVNDTAKINRHHPPERKQKDVYI